MYTNLHELLLGFFLVCPHVLGQCFGLLVEVGAGECGHPCESADTESGLSPYKTFKISVRR